MHDLAIFAVRAETGGVAGATNRSQADNAFIESDRSLEIRDLQSHSSEMRRFRKSILSRFDTAVGRRSHAVSPSGLSPGQKVLTVANIRRITRIACPVSVCTLG